LSYAVRIIKLVKHCRDWVAEYCESLRSRHRYLGGDRRNILDVLRRENPVSLVRRRSPQAQVEVEKDCWLRGDRHSAYASSRSFVPGYLTVKSDELIKKKGAIAFKD
jgi:hypothetical protein